MVSIRVKLFSKKNKKKNNRGPVINSFEQLGDEELKSKILSGDSSTQKSSNSDKRKTTYTAPTSINNKFKELVDKYKNDPDFKKKVKTGGFITLGTALTAGAVAGGAKLLKDKKKRDSNNKVKNSILIKDEDEQQNNDDKKCS